MTKIPSSEMEACILAGGLSTRMGLEKARLKFCGRSLLDHARALADGAGLACRVIRRDVVPRCGPLGGIITALRKTTAPRVLFLSCDMPLVTVQLVQRLMDSSHANVFAETEGRAGFPFCLAAEALTTAEAQHAGERFSLRAFASKLDAGRVALQGKEALQVFNINTPDDLSAALKREA
jgi:molybdopterin-guanine dinucleotide biosynthesis protein A